MNFLSKIKSKDVYSILNNPSYFKQAPQDCFDLDNSDFKIFSSDIILTIFSHLPLKDLTLSRLVCKRWKIQENDNALALFIRVAMKGHEIFYQLSKTYETMMSPFSKDKEKAFNEFIKPSTDRGFAHVLFNIGYACASEEKKQAMKKIMNHYGKLPVEQLCAKSQLILSCCYGDKIGVDANTANSPLMRVMYPPKPFWVPFTKMARV
jgi:hypothetical protein